MNNAVNKTDAHISSCLDNLYWYFFLLQHRRPITINHIVFPFAYLFMYK